MEKSLLLLLIGRGIYTGKQYADALSNFKD